MAAGVTLRPDNVALLRARLNELARRTLKADQLHPTLQIDAEIAPGDLSLQTVAALERLKPFGPGNPPIHFAARGLGHQRPLQRMGANRNHVKLWVTDGRSTQESVWWGAGNEALPDGRFDLAFTPIINEFNGRRTVQLRVLDWRPSG